jgi:hypothetical protein
MEHHSRGPAAVHAPGQSKSSLIKWRHWSCPPLERAVEAAEESECSTGPPILR